MRVYTLYCSCACVREFSVLRVGLLAIDVNALEMQLENIA